MYSVSKIQCYEQCPYKYKLKYIDKVETVTNSACSKGSLVHSILENIDNLEELRYQQKIALEVSDSIKIVDNFLNSEIGKHFLPIIKSAKKETKIGIKKECGRLVQCDFDDPEVLFHGIIDVLKDNYILDYKTGKAKTFDEQDWTQLTWYAIWLFLGSNCEEITITYAYVEHNKVNSKILYRYQLNDLIVEMLSRIKPLKDYENNPSENYKKSPLCDWCDCKAHCKFCKDLSLLSKMKYSFK